MTARKCNKQIQMYKIESFNLRSCLINWRSAANRIVINWEISSTRTFKTCEGRYKRLWKRLVSKLCRSWVVANHPLCNHSPCWNLLQASLHSGSHKIKQFHDLGSINPISQISNLVSQIEWRRSNLTLKRSKRVLSQMMPPHLRYLWWTRI